MTAIQNLRVVPKQSVVRNLLVAGTVFGLQAFGAIAHAQPAESVPEPTVQPAATESAAIDPLAAQPAASPPVAFTQNQRIMYAAISAAVPGVGQIFEKRPFMGYAHLGGAVALGLIAGGGWYYGSQPLQISGAIGLTILSAYSAADAYLASPPRKGSGW